MRNNHKRRSFESAVIAIQQRHGRQALRPASELPAATVPHLATGFDALDQATGCGGVPLGAITLLTGRTTSGKLTVAYKTIATVHRQYKRLTAALVDVTTSVDSDYLARTGVDLERLLIVRPQQPRQVVELLLELAKSRQVRLVVVDGLESLLADRAASRRLNGALHQLNRLLQQSKVAALFVGEPHPPWQRWLNLDRAANLRRWAALYLEMQHERWLWHENRVTGYGARVRVRKSKWVRGMPSAPVEIEFNGIIKARATW